MSDRIISLVPSLTEYLFSLGLGSSLVGRTRFCIHPKSEIEGISIIGGTKNPNIEKIRSLKPTLIIANKEENRKEDVDLLQSFCDVIVTDISTIEEALYWMLEIGKRTGTEHKARVWVSDVQQLLPTASYDSPLSCVYLIWEQPRMSVGGDTYIHSVLSHFGFENCCSHLDRYPVLDDHMLKEFNPDLILLSSEPFPYKESHQQEYQRLLPSAHVTCVDGEWFSWYGSRMKSSFYALREWRSIINQRI